MPAMTAQYPRTFPATGPLTVSVRLDRGHVHVSASDVTEATVDLQPARADDRDALELIERAQVQLRGDALRVSVPRSTGLFGSRRSPAVLVRLTVPTGSSLDCGTGSADARLDGRLGAVSYGTGSGDLTAEICGDVRIRTGSGNLELQALTNGMVKTASGDVTIHRVSGDLQLHTSSGDIKVGELGGDAVITTGSGDIELGNTQGRIRTKTASGDIALRRANAGEIGATTASGDISFGVPEGTAARLDCSSASGEVHSQLESTDGPGDADRHLAVTARTVSGSVTILRAH